MRARGSWQGDDDDYDDDNNNASCGRRKYAERYCEAWDAIRCSDSVGEWRNESLLPAVTIGRQLDKLVSLLSIAEATNAFSRRTSHTSGQWLVEPLLQFWPEALLIRTQIWKPCCRIGSTLNGGNSLTEIGSARSHFVKGLTISCSC